MIKLTLKHLLVVSMILTLFLGLSLVSATDVTDDNAVSTKNICTHSITSDNNDNIDVNDINNYAKNTFTSTSANNGSNSDENINKGNTIGDSNGGTIKDLKDKIDTGGSSIILDTDYTYSDSTDSGLTGGIVVSRDLTIDGQGHTIDLGGQIRFLQSTTSGINLVLKNINIKNGNYTSSSSGGAVYIESGNGSFVNCTFTGNSATFYGGAVYINYGSGSFINSTFTNNIARYDKGGAVYIGGSGSSIFVNCTFTDNNASSGGAVDIAYSNGSFINSIFTGNIGYNGGAVYIVGGNGSFINSTFTNNKARGTGGAVYLDDGPVYIPGKSNGTAILCRFNTETDTIYNLTVIPASINVLNYTSTYQSGEKLEFNLTADDMVFDGFNTTIDIFKDGELVKTIYGLSGEGWIVDLNSGVYTAVLKLTDYPAEKSSNATLNISKEDTTVVIDPIVDAVLGKEVLINFTTNSNGTATIKVNGVPINSATFIPTQAGTYNVTVEVAENDYYNAGSAETNFTVEKLASSIIADAVSTIYTVDKFLVISLKDSNGNPINGADLSVNLRGIKNYTTNEDGQVLINIAKLYPKTYNAMITYEGSDNFNGSTGSAKVTVNKITSSIIAKSPTFKLNQNIKKYTITLKYLSGKLLANKKVTLNFNGKTYTVKTNNKGQGVFKIYKHLKKGVYNAVITVPENSYYNKVIKKVKITVK